MAQSHIESKVNLPKIKKVPGVGKDYIMFMD